MSDVGAVTLAAAGNGANGVARTGDNIYEMQAVIQPADDSGGPAPSINPGGVVLSTLRPAVTTGAPNAIATVFGTEFAPAGTSALAPQLDDAGKVATALAETCVEVGSRRAPLFAVTPGQINFQIPDQAGQGAASRKRHPRLRHGRRTAQRGRELQYGRRAAGVFFC